MPQGWGWPGLECSSLKPGGPCPGLENGGGGPEGSRPLPARSGLHGGGGCPGQLGPEHQVSPSALSHQEKPSLGERAAFCRWWHQRGEARPHRTI